MNPDILLTGLSLTTLVVLAAILAISCALVMRGRKNRQ